MGMASDGVVLRPVGNLRPIRSQSRRFWSLSRTKAMTASSISSCNVAVIGCGAAGLAAARELRAEGHRPVVFEQGGEIGGTWTFDPATDEDPLGMDPHRERVHSSMYASLRTNTPRAMMSYLEFPFCSDFLQALDGSNKKYKPDSRQYPGHQEVSHYLNAFADYYQLRDAVRLHTRVVSAAPVSRDSTHGQPLRDVVQQQQQQQQQQVPQSQLGQAAALGGTGPAKWRAGAQPAAASDLVRSEVAVHQLKAEPAGHPVLPVLAKAFAGTSSPAGSSGVHGGSHSGANGSGARAIPACGTAAAAAGGSGLGRGLRQPLEGDGGPATLSTSPRWHLVTEAVSRSPDGHLAAVPGHHQECAMLTVACDPHPSHQWDFDAVLVCAGHFSEPRLPEELVLAGQRDGFPGFQMHSHSYRSNARFAGQVVLVVGASNSGDDIAREVGQVAQAVHLSARSWPNPAAVPGTPPFGERRNIHRRHMAVRLNPDSSVVLGDGERIERVDSVIYCTGFHYRYPFLADSGIVSTFGHHVFPLWRHLAPPATAPSLGFLGVRWHVLHMPLMELQSRLFARLLSGRVQLPDRRAMLEEVLSTYRQLDESNVPHRYIHMSEGDEQWQFFDWLVAAIGPDVERLPAWRADIFRLALAKWMDPGAVDNYRDTWEDPGGVLAVAQEALREQAGQLLQRRPTLPSHVSSSEL